MNKSLYSRHYAPRELLLFLFLPWLMLYLIFLLFCEREVAHKWWVAFKGEWQRKPWTLNYYD